MALEFPLLTRLTAKDSASTVLSSFAGKAQRLGKKMQRMGRQWSLAVTAPITAVGFSFGRTLVNFETSMNTVGALTGETGERFQSLEDLARKLGKTTAFSAVEAADGMGFLAQAGRSTEEILSELPKVLNLAAAGSLGLAEAADIASNVMTGFGLSTEDAQRAVDVLAFTAASSNTNVRQLGQGMKFVANKAQTTGVSLEEVAAIMGILGDNGVQADMAGTALRGTINALIGPSKEARKVFKSLGFKESDLVDADGKLTSLIGVIEKLKAAGAKPGQINQIFGARPGTAVDALLNTLEKNADSVRARKEEIEQESEGAAQRIADRKLFGLSGALRILSSAWADLGLAVGKSGFGDTLQRLANHLKDALSWISKLEGPTLGWVAGIVGAVAAIGPLLIGLALAAKAFAFMSIGLALLASPIGLTVLAIGALVWAGVWLHKNWDKVIRFFRIAWRKMQTYAGAGVSWITGRVSFLGGAGVLLYKSWGKVATFFVGIWDRIKSTFGDGVAWVTGKLDGLVDKLGGVGRFFGFGNDDGDEPASKVRRLAGSTAPAAVFQQGQGQDGRARVEIDVRSDKPGVRARMIEARDVEVSLEQGLALGAS